MKRVSLNLDGTTIGVDWDGKASTEDCPGLSERRAAVMEALGFKELPVPIYIEMDFEELTVLFKFASPNHQQLFYVADLADREDAVLGVLGLTCVDLSNIYSLCTAYVNEQIPLEVLRRGLELELQAPNKANQTVTEFLELLGLDWK